MDIFFSSSPSQVIHLGESEEANTPGIINICERLRKGELCNIEGIVLSDSSMANLLCYLCSKKIKFDLNEVFSSQGDFWGELLKRETEKMDKVNYYKS